jgi:pimeloyl-ACP methyl ester carboxylesterase
MTAVQMHGTEMYCEERGTGTPVLLIHGTGCNLHTWGEAFDLVSAEHRAIAYDRRGYGRSGRPPAKDYGQHARDAANLLKALDATPAIVVGWSSGGIVALELAIGRPSDVAALVLVEPPLFWQLHPTASLLRLYARVHALRVRGRHRQAAELILRWVTTSTAGGNSFDQIDPGLREEMLADAVTTVGEWVPSRRPGSGEHLRRRHLAPLSCPIEILVGECSNPHFASSARRFVRLRPETSVEHVAGATHSLPLERPHAVRDAVKRAAATASSGGTAAAVVAGR